MFHLRLGAGIAAASVFAHTLYVYGERRKSPTGRLLQFSPGSQDDLIADSLRTGDVVCFSRDCVLYGLCGAAACVGRKAVGGVYDHVGVVYLVHGVPHVLEYTPSGVKLRVYSARVRCSRSREVVVRPLRPQLNPEELEAAAGFVSRVVEKGGGGKGVSPPEAMTAALLNPLACANALGELGAMAYSPGSNPSAAFVGEFYGACGVVRGGGASTSSTTSPSPPLDMSSLAPNRQPKWSAPGRHFGSPVWVRDLN